MIPVPNKPRQHVSESSDNPQSGQITPVSHNFDSNQRSASPRHARKETTTSGASRCEKEKPQSIAEYTNKLRTARSPRRVSLKEGAAVVIQATYRGHLVRKKNNWKTQCVKTTIFDQLLLRSKQLKSGQESTVVETSSSNASPKLTKSSSTESSESVISVKAQNKSTDSPNFQKTILLVGGVNPRNRRLTTDDDCYIYRLSVEENKWDRLARMEFPRYYHASSVLRGKLYIVGGCDPGKEDMPINPENLSFDLVGEVWSSEPQLRIPRKSFGLVTLDDHLYAIGGQDEHDTILTSVERFDADRKVWEIVAPLPQPAIGAAVCVHKHLIWVAGGLLDDSANVRVSSDVWCYDSLQDTWIKKASLRLGRAFASLATFDDHLFFVGGVTTATSGVVSNDHIDIWDAENQMWKLKGNIDPPRHAHSVSFIDSSMVIMGGVTTRHVKDLTQVDAVCMMTGSRSKRIASLPTPLVGNSCVTVCS